MALRSSLLLVTAGALALAACSDNSSYETAEAVTTMDVAEEPMADAAPPPPPAIAEAEAGSDSSETSSLPAIPAAAPKIAYVYSYGFRVGRDEIAPLQERHADMCIKLGPLTCQVRSLQQNGAEDDYGYGELQLSVAADKAREFGRELVAATTAHAAAALGLNEGAIHAELRLHDGRAWVIDIAGRSIGGLCASVLSFKGVSLEELLLRHALGRKLPSLKRDGAAVGVRMLYPPSAGTLRSVRGLAAAETVAGVTGLRITAHRGQELLPPPEGGTYLGFIFASGENAAEVVAALSEAAGKLDIQVDGQS